MIPQEEKILATIAQMMPLITVANGYATNILSGGVSRRLRFIDDVINTGILPAVSVILRPQQGQVEIQHSQYRAVLKVWIVGYFRSDNTNGEIPDTVMLNFKNDVQTCLYDNFQTYLNPQGAVSVLFDEAPQIGVGIAEGALTDSTIYITASLDYFIPMGGF